MERLDYLHDGITRCMLMSARSAEKACGLVTCNGVRKSRCRFSGNTPEITQISSELRTLSELDGGIR